MVVSIDVALFSWSDSNTHISEPSSFTSFHHRRPTKILPETFFTNQKSNAPRIEASIAWETPVKQIETLVDVLGIDPVKIADYYCDKLDMPAIIANIRTQLSLYIKHIVDTSTIESAKQDILADMRETETPRPKTKKTKK